MYLYLIVPFYSEFSLKSGIFVEDNSYIEFCNSLTNSLTEEEAAYITLLHTNRADGMRYKVIKKDANLLKEEVIKFNSNQYLQDIIDNVIAESGNKHFANAEKQSITYHPNSSIFTLFDNTIGVYEITLQISDEFMSLDVEMTDKLQLFTNDLCQNIISKYYRNIILPFIKKISKLDIKNNFLEKINHYGFPNIQENNLKESDFQRRTPVGKALWVNRTAIVDVEQNIDVNFFNDWIFSEEDKAKIIEKLKQSNSDEKNGVYLGWGNNYIYADINNQVVKDAQKTLILSQYYYAILDSLGQNLSCIIGTTKNINSFNKNKKYRALLNELVNTANLIEINHIDTLQNLQGNRESFFRDIIKKWAFDDLFLNIERKKNISQNKIQEQYQISFKKGQTMAELLLFFLGGISLLEFANTLISYWSANSGLKDNIPGLYDIGNLLPPDAILWGAFFLLSIFFIVYYKFYISRKD